MMGRRHELSGRIRLGIIAEEVYFTDECNRWVHRGVIKLPDVGALVYYPLQSHAKVNATQPQIVLPSTIDAAGDRSPPPRVPTALSEHF